MKKLLVVCGATASGKTALAAECAKRLGGEVVSCDSLLIYKRLNIGTAKPTEEERMGIPHRLIDVAEPWESFSVSDFERLALKAVEEIVSLGKVPVLCGGTGFYMNSVLFQSSFGKTPASPALREKYQRIFKERGGEYLHGLLKECDGESAEKLHPNDVKRVIRALEIFELTGKRKSEQHDGQAPRFLYEAFAFDYPREELYARIDSRVDAMLRAGLVDEVKGLIADGIPENAQCMQGIGYKEVVESLKNGDLNSTMSDIIKKNTRNYAKRQLTFFKRLPNLHWIAPKPVEEAAREVCEIYER